jgi:MFS family permease
MNNRTTLLWASFLTLIAAGVGFAIRGGILGDWGAQYGFTKGELGTITGGGLVGFGVTILICSLIVDRVGYKPLLILAFVLHALSAVITLAATPIHDSMGKDATYWCLYLGMFMFALANGVCESVINPLVATLYPKQKTHYLNILHAGWPGGLILGGVFAYLFCGPNAQVSHLRWEIPMAMFLVPTVIYGIMVLKEKFPQSEATAAGVSFGEQLATFASPVLIVLLVLHACIGYVELGTDSWITNIMNNSVGNYAMLLFVYTSALMFILRFVAGPIVERINPLGLLMVSSVFGCIGLYWLGSASGLILIAAATIYALGKTFLWPTILGVVGERFPKGGALVMGAMGGVGMLSAGLLGGPGIGFKQDYYASKTLNAESAPTYDRYKAEKENSFLGIFKARGLDGSKVATIEDKGKQLAADIEAVEKSGRKISDVKGLGELNTWWATEGKPNVDTDEKPVKTATIVGGQRALQLTAAVPATMAVGFALLVAYFAMTGGYKQVEIHGKPGEKGEKYTGGVEGPVQA